MTKNGNGFTSLSKGLFIGGLLGAGIMLLHASRNGIGHSGDLVQRGERSQRRNRPLPAATVEESVDTGARARPSVGWRVTFYVASVVAMISDWKLKKT